MVAVCCCDALTDSDQYDCYYDYMCYDHDCLQLNYVSFSGAGGGGGGGWGGGSGQACRVEGVLVVGAGLQ